MLFYPNRNKPFILETDASDTGFGARLSQNDKTVGFYSKKISKSEINYTVMEKEIMSIIRSLEYFKYLIWNSKVIIKTDNKDLISKKDLSTRAQRWKLRLEEFDYEFKFI
ncbi:Retrovirus-related Pol polyprotein from transposon 17.6 [Dictyocoela muelleri]|nr:Retrovirus-related Pol polyprotein from transposon 17.6 [Dictyocoela muelleri]